MLLTIQTADPERFIGVAGLSLIGVFVVILFVRWLFSGSPSPDPWNEDVTRELAAEEGTPICHHCLSEHSVAADFCPHCGAAVGTYTNLLPFPYLFSVGHTLRLGTNGEYKRTFVTVFGFLLLGAAEYIFFAPVYWYKVLSRLKRGQTAQTAPSPESHHEHPPG